MTLKDISELVDRWDRTIGAPRPPAHLGHDGDDTHHSHPQSGRRGKKDKGDKHGKHDSLDKEQLSKASDKEKEVCWSGRINMYARGCSFSIALK